MMIFINVVAVLVIVALVVVGHALNAVLDEIWGQVDSKLGNGVSLLESLDNALLSEKMSYLGFLALSLASAVVLELDVEVQGDV